MKGQAREEGKREEEVHRRLAWPSSYLCWFYCWRFCGLKHRAGRNWLGLAMDRAFHHVGAVVLITVDY